jgi:putative peptide zinc metalloprotease protein
LPALRPDVEIFAGPLEEDGSPTYVIHDPVAGVFNKIGFGEAAVLQRLRRGQTLLSMVCDLGKQTTLNATPEEVVVLCEDAEKHGLTIESQVRPAEKLLETANSKKTGPLKWLAAHYLYFRIPLIHPDKFLTRALPWARLLAARQAIFMYLFVACIGLYFLSQRFEIYASTFTHFVSVKGLMAYVLVIVILKAAHEFGHAFMAKHYGVRVPTMGLAFMVFAPLAYSDVTDAWRLRSRKKRLAIALAGVKVELIIGAFAMALWGLTQPGVLNSLCFLLSSTTLASTFLINLNPAMRFDGYYILSDLWGIDNLSTQSTHFTKWFLRRNLLGLDAPCPIKKQTPRKQLQMVCYSFFAWTYRFFLYMGIAVIVYYKFTKTLGVTLFVLQIMKFIVRPILEESKILMKMSDQIKFNWKIAVTLTVILLVVGWAVCPLPRIEVTPAVILPASSQTLYAPKAGQIKEILFERGDRVNTGDVVVHLASESLNNRIDYLSVSSKLLRHEIETSSMDHGRRAMVPEMEKQWAAIDEELAGLIEHRNRFAVKAKISGTLVELDPLLSPDGYVREHQALGRIASTDRVRIDAFVSEKDVNHLVIGQDVVFCPIDHSGRVPGIIERVDPVREVSVDYLDIGALAAKELPLVQDHASDKLTLLKSYYKATIAVKLSDQGSGVLPDSSASQPGKQLVRFRIASAHPDQRSGLARIRPVTGKHPANARLGESGFLRYRTQKRSLAWELLLYCYSVLVRESSF